jgi:hypothetical protein
MNEESSAGEEDIQGSPPNFHRGRLCRLPLLNLFENPLIKVKIYGTAGLGLGAKENGTAPAGQAVVDFRGSSS